MKSKNDPILDAEAICQEAPVTEEELTSKLKALGWHPGLITDVIRMSTGTYITKSDDGKFRAIRR